MVCLGETERAERAIAELGEQEREHGQIRIATAVLRLAQGNPRAAINALAPVLDGSAPVTRSTWLAQAFLLEATARDALGDPAAGRALRYLPTHLSAPEIASELSVSVSTVRTHIRHVCDKLGAHGRTEAVARARTLGLLAPAFTRPL